MPHDVALLHNYLVIGAILFAAGLVGFLVRRNLIVMFLCAEMMLQGVSLSLVAWGRYHNDLGGQMLVIFIITVAAAEAGIGLALILMLFRQSGSLDIVFWQQIREDNQAAHVDRKIPEERAEEQIWPTLTRAGVRPEIDEEEQLQRSRV